MSVAYSLYYVPHLASCQVVEIAVLPMSDCMPPCCSVDRRQTKRCWLGCHQWFWMDQLTNCLQAEVSSAHGPFITDLHQDGTYQADHRLIIGQEAVWGNPMRHCSNERIPLRRMHYSKFLQIAFHHTAATLPSLFHKYLSPSDRSNRKKFRYLGFEKPTPQK